MVKGPVSRGLQWETAGLERVTHYLVPKLVNKYKETRNRPHAQCRLQLQVLVVAGARVCQSAVDLPPNQRIREERWRVKKKLGHIVSNLGIELERFLHILYSYAQPQDLLHQWCPPQKERGVGQRRDGQAFISNVDQGRDRVLQKWTGEALADARLL